MRGFFTILLYASFGLAFMVVFGDASTTRITDAMFWAWVLGWPVIIGMTMLKWALIVVAIVAAIVFFMLWKDSRG